MGWTLELFGQDDAKTVRHFIHPQARIQSYPEQFKAEFEKRGVLTAEQAVASAVDIYRRKGVGRLCICEVTWIAGGVSGYLIDAQGDFMFQDNHYTIFRLGITDSPQSTGYPDFPNGAGEEFIFIAKGQTPDGRPVWLPGMGPDFQFEPQKAAPEWMLTYNYLLYRERFETLADRYPPCPPPPQAVLTAELLDACYRGEAEKARQAVLEGADVNVRDEVGRSPLLLAISFGQSQSQLIRLLVEQGADVNIATSGGGKTISGYTPLMSACDQGDRDTVNLLLEHRAKVDVLDEYGRSPLSLSLNNSRFEMLDLLLQHGANINIRDQNGHTLLMKYVSEQKNKYLKWFLSHGADLDVQDTKGKTALMLAAEQGNLDAVRILVEAGASVESRDKNGWTVLAAAVFMGQKEVVAYLLSVGNATAMQTNDEGTPLIVEASRRLTDADTDIMRMLIRKNAFLDDQDRKGNTPLSEAAFRDKWELVRLLVNLGADINQHPASIPPVLTQAYWAKRLDMVEWLLAKGADPENRYTDQSPFWVWPFADKKTNLARLILEHAPSVDIMDVRGVTPLMWASRLGWTDFVSWLLRKGANVNLASHSHKTALMEASEKGHIEIVNLLIQYGADVHAQTQKGWTALMWAAEKGYDLVVKRLLAVGADPDVTNQRGQNALAIARMNKRLETVSLLEAARKRIEPKSRFRFKPILFLGGLVSILFIFLIWRIFIKRKK